jgi:hypothetical protein
VYAWRIILLIGSSVLTCWTTPAAAEILEFGTWDGAVEALVDYASVDIESAGDTGNAVEIENTRQEQRVTMRSAESFLIDPRLATFTLGGTFGLSQEDYGSVAGGVATGDERDADLSGYDFLTTLLPQNATLSAELFANRNQYVQTRELAGRTDIDVENFGATLRAMRLYIPSSLSIRRERFEEEASTAASEVNTDERRDVLRYEGLRGWVNKQMTLRYELVDKTDRFRPSLDYRNQDATLSTIVDFGPELNRTWRSWTRVNSRDGFSAQDRLETTQSLQISHGRNLRTSYRYSLEDIERSGGKTKSHMAAFSLNHQLYESLTTDIAFDATDQSFDDGQRDVYTGFLNLRYTKRLPASGRLNASFGTTRAREDDDFEEAFVPQELRTFDIAFATPAYLDNPNVIEDSVEVTKVADGPPVAGCPAFPTPISLVEGVDYLLRTVGNRSEIVPQPCSATSPGINPGDTIAVDYRFTRGGEPVSFDTVTNRLNASVDYGWIRPFLSLERSDQDIVSGVDTGFLTDRRSTIIGIELRGQWPRLQGNLRLETEATDSDDQVFDDDRVTAQLRYTVTPRLRLLVNGVSSSARYSFPEVRESDLLLMRAELTYGRNGNLDGSLFASLQDLEDSRVPDERKSELGIRARWRLGKLTVNGTMSVLDAQRDTQDSRDYRVMLRVKRRFSWR